MYYILTNDAAKSLKRRHLLAIPVMYLAAKLYLVIHIFRVLILPTYLWLSCSHRPLFKK